MACILTCGYYPTSQNTIAGQNKTKVAAAGERLLTKEQWLADLDFTITKMKEIHPNIYYRIKEDEFNKVVEQSRFAIEHADSDFECYNAIRKVVASIKDGHTLLSYSGKIDFQASRLPLRINYFTDGCFITAIDTSNKELLGAQVSAVDGVPLEEAMQKIMNITSMDNDYGRRDRAMEMLRFPLVLFGLGISKNKSSVTLTLIDKQGTTFKHQITAIESFNDNELYTLKSLLQSRTPLHLKNTQKYYWFEYLPESKAVYFQLNVVNNEPGNAESFDQFIKRFWQYVDDHTRETDKIIIDLRNNTGGSGRMVIPFVKEIIKRDRINTSGRLFTIVGNKTFSAAVVFITELITYTETVFVGDPTGCPSNLFSNNTAAGFLPNSNYRLYVATRQIDNSWSSNRDFFPPDIPASFSSAGYFNGEDPALDIIVQGKAVPMEILVMNEGVDNGFRLYNEIIRNNPDATWWNTPANLEDKINIKGYSLLSKNDMIKAGNLFRFNTLAFPKSWNAWDSMAEFYLASGEYGLSYDSYRKSFELDSGNANHLQAVERTINSQGYAVLRENTEKATELFRLNTKLFPVSSNAWDSLGEAYMMKGDTVNAIKSYKKSLELNPRNENAGKMLEKLK